MQLWSDQMFWKLESAAETISEIIVKTVIGRLRPPYLRGISTPVRPAFFIASMFSNVLLA